MTHGIPFFDSIIHLLSIIIQKYGKPKNDFYGPRQILYILFVYLSYVHVINVTNNI